ncbi:MAG: 30S ribosome-binding factor RbfA [Nitrospira sp.]|nr:30S ribosome-binding factor RbfA [Nitrospira sp.]HBP87707.1 30S ribosome-binding factor RbfA [Nitrospiraceae bacterium]HNP29712.1 30S ribosome-binding factor RbfA [Nitrospirales bacterium]
MAKTNVSRATRVADQIRMEVAEILSRKTKDPRIQFVTVTGVKMTGDLKIARVYVTALDQVHFDQVTGPGLKSAVGFIRTELGRRLNLRYTPELVFYRDTSAEYGNRIEKLLDSLPEEAGDLSHPFSPNKSESLDE